MENLEPSDTGTLSPKYWIEQYEYNNIGKLTVILQGSSWRLILCVIIQYYSSCDTIV